jgi:hypothetical protein
MEFDEIFITDQKVIEKDKEYIEDHSDIVRTRKK